jgi:hypothetical protein
LDLECLECLEYQAFQMVLAFQFSPLAPYALHNIYYLYDCDGDDFFLRVLALCFYTNLKDFKFILEIF